MQPVSARYEQLPDGVLRTHGWADRQLTNQLAYAEFRAGPAFWVALAPGLFLLPVIIVSAAVSLVGGGSLSWQYLAVMLAWPPVMALVLLGVPLWGSIWRFRRSWRRELPVGTPIHADFGQEWIGIGWKGTYSAVMLAQLRRVRQVGSTLVLTGGGNTVFLPGAQVPPGIASDLLSGRWREKVGQPSPADYGPDWIGLRLGGHVQTAQLSDVKRVDEVGGVLVLTLRGFRPGMVIPGELVPPHIGAELVGRIRS